MGSLFSRNGGDESDYEKILTDLDNKIRRAEIRLSEIRMRERRAQTVWLVYSTIAYTLYVLGFFVYLSNPYDEWSTWTVKITPVILVPFIIMFVKSLLNLWYRRKQTNEESELSNLRAEQKFKLEELKKKTAYYSTKSLLERFDSPNSRSASAPPPRDRQGLPANAPPQKVQNEMARGGPGQQPPPFGGRPLPQQRPGAGRPPPVPAGQIPPPTGPPGYPQQPTSYGNPTAPVTPRRWYDKLVDVIVGDEGPETKYALICEQCYTHNGLALAEEAEDTQYICSKCGHFNPSKRKKRMGGPLGLPASAAQHHQRPNSTPLPLNGDPSTYRGRSLTPRSIDGPADEEQVSGYTIGSRSRSTTKKATVNDNEENENEDEPEVVEMAGEELHEEEKVRRRSGRNKKTANN